MACCLPGADDAANVLVSHCGYHEQDFSPIHAEALNPLLAMIEPVIKGFDLPWIMVEADAVLDEIGRRLGRVPFIFHAAQTTEYR
jgi:hypothetical protein